MSKTRVPAIPAPTDDNLRDVARAVKGVLDVREGLLGDPLDASVTFRDLVDGGVVSVSTTSRGGGSSSISVTPGGSGGYDPTADLNPPPQPTGFSATAGVAVVILSWTEPTYSNHAYTEVWRATTDVIGNAIRVGTTEASVYTDAFPDATGTWYYWIRFVSQANITGPYNATSGTSVTIGPSVNKLLDALNGKLSESQLVTSLNSRINLVDAPTTGLVTKVADLQTTYGNTASSATNAAAAAASASAAASSEAAAILAKSNAQTASAAAASSQSAAATSEANALLAQTGAVTAKDQAVTAKTNAETAASNASTFATSAANSATGAAGSASTATTQATNAANSATAAGNSATAANTSATNAATSATNAATSATAASSSSVSAASSFNASIRLNGNWDFSQGKTGWSTAPADSTYAEIGGALQTGGVTGNAKVQFAGSAEGHWNRRIPIQTNRVYRVRFRVKATGTTGSVVYAGVATFDANGALETTEPGTHRYCAAVGVSVPNDGTWKVYEGTITGTGNSTPNQFRPGSVFASPMFIVNYTQASNFVCEVDECSIEDITESTSAGNSAAAAATSASTATTQASSAATSASAANTSAANASTSASNASSGASQAATSATNASGSATSAATSATNAANSANAAGTSASNASTSASQAATSATNAAGSASTASTEATNAANSATAAGGSATSASNSASSASTSATNAGNSATAANTAKVAAESARDAAAGSASAAATSASTATTKATEAAQSASSASTSATNASTSAGQAATSASNASTSASQASTSASNAAGSESAAATSATNSANSATAAGGSASAAAGSASAASTSATNAGNSATSASASSVSAQSAFGQAVRLAGNWFFSEGKAGWSMSASYYAETDGTVLSGATNSVTGGASLRLSGDRWIYWNKLIPVQLTRSYRVRFRVRNVGGTPSIIYAGVATYDAAGNLETSGAGTHRYCAALGPTVPADNAWYVYEGVITGGGSGSYNQFRTTTAFASPMCIVNYNQGSGGICDVDELSIEDITESVSAAGSASAAATSASTASTKASEAASSASSASTSATNASTSAGNALTYSNNASSSANTATTKANEASTSASAAATSASNAAGSASAASTSANTASTKATEASNSASAANTSATNASTSASSAGTFASNSATSASNAAGSASSAATSLTQVQATIRGTSLGLPLEQWNLNGQSIVTISDGKVGSSALRLAGINGAYPNQGNYIAINPGKRYRVKFWARPSSDAAGVLYFALRQFVDANGATTGPVNGGRSPYKPSNWSRASHIATYGDTWGEFNFVWSDSDWQSGVRYVQPEFLDNYPSAAGYWEIQGYTFTDVTDIEQVSVAVQTEATARANADNTLFAQYTVKIDNNGYVTGYGLASTSVNGTPTSEFAVVADQFSIAPVATNPNAADGSPFFHLTSPQTINGVSVPAGTYMKAAFIADATIDTAKIKALAVDNSKIADLTVGEGKIADGAITNLKIGSFIQSNNYSAGSAGWQIRKDGYAEFGSASIRGQLTASQIDSRGLSIKDESGNTILSAGSPLSFSNITPAAGWLNSNVSISSSGALSGAGGGQVTINGLGYSGDLNATYGAVAGVTLRDSNGRVTSDARLLGNLIDATTWVSGSSGSQTGFNQLTNGDTSNQIVLSSLPDGSSGPVWRATSGASGNAQGGWDGAAVSIENGKTYRFSVWTRRSSTSDSGTFYFGCASNTVSTFGGTGPFGQPPTVQSNPYFVAAPRSQLPQDVWVLFVAYVFSGGTASNPFPASSGYYLGTDGTKLGDTVSYKWSNAGVAALRAYQFYTTAAGEVQDFWGPRLDIVDGTEPSVDMLLAGGKAYAASLTATWGGVDSRPANLASLAGNEAIKNTQISVSGGAITGIGTGSGAVVDNSYIPSGVNLQYNSDFMNRRDGWVAAGGSGISGESDGGVNFSADWYLAPGGVAGSNVFWSCQNGRVGNDSYYYEYRGRECPVIGGRRYAISAYTGAHRCKVAVFAYVFDAAGNGLTNTYLGVQNENNEESSGGKALSGYKRVYSVMTLPSNAAYVQVRLRKYDTKAGNSDSYMFVAQVQVEEAAASATTPGSWNPMGYVADNAIGITKFGEDIQTTNYAANSAGWRITKAGQAFFNDVQVRGVIAGGAYGTSYAWPAAGQNGFHLGPGGLLLGNPGGTGTNYGYFQIEAATGNIYAPQFSVVNGQLSIGGGKFIAQTDGTVYADTVDIRRRVVLQNGTHDTTEVVIGYSEIDGPYYPPYVTPVYTVQARILTDIYDANTQSLSANQPYYVAARANGPFRNWNGNAGSTFQIAVFGEVAPQRAFSNSGNYSNDNRLVITLRFQVVLTAGLFNSFRMPTIDWTLFKL